MKIFFDSDTQNDFLSECKPALYVSDGKLIKPNLRKLTDYARENFIPVIGSLVKHFGTPEYKDRETDLKKWGGPVPDHCMQGSVGEMKIFETILKEASLRFDQDYDHSYDIPHRIWHGFPKEPIPEELHNKFHGFYSKRWIRKHWEQLRKGAVKTEIKEAINLLKKVQKKKEIPKGVYFEKQSYDVFTNPSFPVFLDMAKIKQAVVYGIQTDTAIKAAVLGMREKGIQCYIVKDAITGTPSGTKLALEEMILARAKFVTTNEIVGDKK